MKERGGGSDGRGGGRETACAFLSFYSTCTRLDFLIFFLIQKIHIWHPTHFHVYVNSVKIGKKIDICKEAKSWGPKNFLAGG